MWVTCPRDAILCGLLATGMLYYVGMITSLYCVGYLPQLCVLVAGAGVATGEDDGDAHGGLEKAEGILGQYI